MKDQQASYPQLRFKGFTDPWEERKLSEIGKIVTGNTPSTSNKGYYNGDFLFVSPADIQENRYVNKTTTTLTELGFKTGRLVPKGATLFVSIGSTIGKIGQSICDVITNQQINSVISFSDYDDDFIYTSILNSSTKIKQLAATQAVPIINKNEFGKSIIKIPSLEEQQKIGAFFKQLDDTIALHQRKLAKLKELKQGYLQKLFPRNGSKFPQLRFAGFADAWEERKLSSISERVTRKNKNNESTLPLTISAQDGLVDQNDFFNKQVASRDVTGYFLVKNGEFAYNKSYSNGYPWGAIKRLDKYDMGVLSTLYIVFRPTKINSQFLVSYYDTTRWYREVSKNAAEGARNHGLLNIAPTDFFNTLLVVPKIVDEQQKIGSFFKQLDDTIALHQRKLEKLQELKKGYLQKMFC